VTVVPSRGSAATCHALGSAQLFPFGFELGNFVFDPFGFAWLVFLLASTSQSRSELLQSLVYNLNSLLVPFVHEGPLVL